jgi:hypothetical protein
MNGLRNPSNVHPSTHQSPFFSLSSSIPRLLPRLLVGLLACSGTIGPRNASARWLQGSMLSVSSLDPCSHVRVVYMAGPPGASRLSLCFISSTNEGPRSSTAWLTVFALERHGSGALVGAIRPAPSPVVLQEDARNPCEALSPKISFENGAMSGHTRHDRSFIRRQRPSITRLSSRGTAPLRIFDLVACGCCIRHATPN